MILWKEEGKEAAEEWNAREALPFRLWSREGGGGRRRRVKHQKKKWEPHKIRSSAMKGKTSFCFPFFLLLPAGRESQVIPFLLRPTESSVKGTGNVLFPTAFQLLKNVKIDQLQIKGSCPLFSHPISPPMDLQCKWSSNQCNKLEKFIYVARSPLLAMLFNHWKGTKFLPLLF